MELYPNSDSDSEFTEGSGSSGEDGDSEEEEAFVPRRQTLVFKECHGLKMRAKS